ncbi:MFS transporter [Gluconobacter potus]|uniref:MFS transporter n=1 Tax=Gluconobacter potus TaxID=2724927 RepID=UPI0007860E4B|nr:MFS transporter [Gluconobacter potus]
MTVIPAIPGWRRRLSVSLLVMAGCISYIDRAALSIGNTAIMSSMHMSYTGMGWLLSVFAWAYLVSQIPAGLLADRLGGRMLLGAGLCLWSCAQIGFGLMQGVAGLFVCRILLGVGESPLFLAGTRVLVRWFPPEERGTVIGLFNGSAALGPALAPPLLLAIMAFQGWRGMSVSIGILSLLLGLVWVLYYRDPTRTASAPSPPPSILRDDLGYLLRQRSSWIVTAGFAGIIYLTWLYATWLPAWLQSAYHLTATQAGLLSALPQICGFAGNLTGGLLSDRLMARGMRRLDACRRPLVISMVVAAVMTGLTALDTGLSISMVFMAAALFAGGIAMSAGWTLGTVIAAEHRVATLEAIQNTGGSLGGALAPVMTGIMVDHFGSFAPSMLVACGVGLTCAAIYQFGLRETDASDRHAPFSVSPFSLPDPANQGTIK